MSIDAQITAFLEGALVIATLSVNLLILFIKFKSNNVRAQFKTIPFWATLLINAHVPRSGDTLSACKPAAFCGNGYQSRYLRSIQRDIHIFVRQIICPAWG